MNKTYIGIIIGVIVVGAVAVLLINQLDLGGANPEDAVVPAANIARPAVKPVPNTFSIMTPEEKAAAEEAERIAVVQASSTSTTTATTTDGAADDTEAPVEDTI